MADSISTDEAVKISGYNVQHIRRLIREAKITAQKKGGQYWVDRKSLLEYLESVSRPASASSTTESTQS